MSAPTVTDHPSALVSVPEPMIEAFRDWYALHFGRPIMKGKARKIVGRILSAAPAAPQAAGVGEIAKACAVFQEAIDYFEADVADVMAEGSERADLWDREVTVNIDALKAVMNAALATREEAPADPCASHKDEGISLDPCCPTCEAPAEAGEDQFSRVEAIVRRFPGPIISDLDHGRLTGDDILDLIEALAAQPQAREDAQPVISAGRVLADALRQYGFPVSGGAKAALSDHGSAEALALNEACVAFLAALQDEQKGGA